MDIHSMEKYIENMSEISTVIIIPYTIHTSSKWY